MCDFTLFNSDYFLFSILFIPTFLYDWSIHYTNLIIILLNYYYYYYLLYYYYLIIVLFIIICDNFMKFSNGYYILVEIYEIIIDKNSILTHECMEAYNRLFVNNFFLIHVHVIFQIKDQSKIFFYIRYSKKKSIIFPFNFMQK